MKRSLTLMLLAAVSSLIVFLGSWITVDNARYNNNFIRSFPPHAADVSKTREIAPDRYLIAGVTNNHLYLYDRSGILITNRDLTDTTRVDLDLKFGSEVVIDSPYFFIENSNSMTLQRGRLENWTVDKTFDGLGRYTAIQSISPESMVTRLINFSERKNFLRRSWDSTRYLLEKQVDGILCTDGFLQYSHDLHQLIYVYRYRNQFVCLDTSLNVVRYGKTIDTTSVAKISVKEIEGKITMSKPPLTVNNNAVVNGKYLFVQSNLIARNELPRAAKDRTVIDVYNILDGSYRFSFYIDNYPNSRVQAFLVKDSTLVAVFRQAVATYDLPSAYFP